MRVNFDGSIDYVTCWGTDDPGEWRASARDPDGTWAEIAPSAAYGSATPGEVVHFDRPPAPWRLVSVGADLFSSATIESRSVALGQWRWNNEGGLFEAARGEGKHCDVIE